MQDLAKKLNSIEEKLNVLTDQDLISKIDEFNKKVDKIKKIEGDYIDNHDWNNLPMMLSVKDVKKVLNISLNYCYELFKQKGFPSINFNCRYLISKEAFREWLNQQSEEQL